MGTLSVGMKWSSLIASNQSFTPFFFVQLLVLVTLSSGLLSTTVLEISGRSPHRLLFTAAPIQYSAKGHSSISSWSKIAEYDVHSSSWRLIDPDDVSATTQSSINHAGKESFPHSLEHDLVSPRGWLEYCEATQEIALEKNTQEQSCLDRACAGGAYTVLRCDFLLKERSWKIWGKDFHLNRLRESFRLLLQQIDFDLTSRQGISENRLKFEDAALDSSLAVMNLLLEEAKTTILSENNMNGIFSIENESKSTMTAMLTLLWDINQNYPKASTNNKSPIRVQGHIFSTLKVQQLHNDSDMSEGKVPAVGSNPNTSSQVVIGYFPRIAHNQVLDHYKLDGNWPDPTFLPNRYKNFPRAKLSSWCRRRRLLEDIFKLKGMGDVILTKDCDDQGNFRKQESTTSSVAGRSATKITESSVELLEGLTTNLFAVYPGRILRTAPSKYVLGGYVRKMIIDCAEKCGYKVEFRTISLADSYLWEEVFLTSSIRLIVPVKRILLPRASGVNKKDELFKLETLWEARSDEKRESDDTIPSLTASDAFYFELIALLTQNENNSLAKQKRSTE